MVLERYIVLNAECKGTVFFIVKSNENELKAYYEVEDRKRNVIGTFAEAQEAINFINNL